MLNNFEQIYFASLGRLIQILYMLWFWSFSFFTEWLGPKTLSSNYHLVKGKTPFKSRISENNPSPSTFVFNKFSNQKMVSISRGPLSLVEHRICRMNLLRNQGIYQRHSRIWVYNRRALWMKIFCSCGESFLKNCNICNSQKIFSCMLDFFTQFIDYSIHFS
jgi:hypothetical protein